MKIAVVGGGIAGLAAARRLESLLPDAEIILLERDERLGGKIQTERVGGFVIEEAPDSFLSRKERGVELCEELGLADELIGRRQDKGSFVRIGSELHPLPPGLTGLIPTNVDALAQSPLLSPEGRERLAAEVDIAPAPPGEDESIASFVSRRLGREAYEKLVEPLLAGIFGGDGEHLSLRATFPALRTLELEHGSVIRGLLAQSPSASTDPSFVALRRGMDALVGALVHSLEHTQLRTASPVSGLEERSRDGFSIELDSGVVIAADAVVLAVPAFVAADLLFEVDEDLAASHREIPYGSSAIVTLAYAQADVRHPLDGYGYVVPRSEGSDVLACTWTSRKWEGRAPEDAVLLRVYAGRFGARDVTAAPDSELVSMARTEVRFLRIEAGPVLTRIHRWRRGMPQYVLGHPERLARIEAALSEHPGLAVAGAAYHGVGIPDCIHSGEAAAESVACALASATR